MVCIVGLICTNAIETLGTRGEYISALLVTFNLVVLLFAGYLIGSRFMKAKKKSTVVQPALAALAVGQVQQPMAANAMANVNANANANANANSNANANANAAVPVVGANANANGPAAEAVDTAGPERPPAAARPGLDSEGLELPVMNRTAMAQLNPSQGLQGASRNLGPIQRHDQGGSGSFTNGPSGYSQASLSCGASGGSQAFGGTGSFTQNAAEALAAAAIPDQGGVGGGDGGAGAYYGVPVMTQTYEQQWTAPHAHQPGQPLPAHQQQGGGGQHSSPDMANQYQSSNQYQAPQQQSPPPHQGTLRHSGGYHQSAPAAPLPSSARWPAPSSPLPSLSSSAAVGPEPAAGAAPARSSTTPPPRPMRPPVPSGPPGTFGPAGPATTPTPTPTRPAAAEAGHVEGLEGAAAPRNWWRAFSRTYSNAADALAAAAPPRRQLPSQQVVFAVDHNDGDGGGMTEAGKEEGGVQGRVGGSGSGQNAQSRRMAPRAFSRMYSSAAEALAAAAASIDKGN